MSNFVTLPDSSIIASVSHTFNLNSTFSLPLVDQYVGVWSNTLLSCVTFTYSSSVSNEALSSFAVLLKSQLIVPFQFPTRIFRPLLWECLRKTPQS